MSKHNPDELETEQSIRQKTQLELLVSEGKNDSLANFKANVGDKRFESILKKKEFAIDPTNKEFRKAVGGEYIKEQ